MTKMPLWAIILLLAVATPIFDQSLAVARDSPVNTVTQYYSADIAGFRLSSACYRVSDIRLLVNWADEPGWDMLFITNKARISKVTCPTAQRCLVDVLYDNIAVGSINRLTYADFTQAVTFTLQWNGRRWVIMEPIIPPHVSEEALKRFMEEDGENDKHGTCPPGK